MGRVAPDRTLNDPPLHTAASPGLAPQGLAPQDRAPQDRASQPLGRTAPRRGAAATLLVVIVGSVLLVAGGTFLYLRHFRGRDVSSNQARNGTNTPAAVNRAETAAPAQQQADASAEAPRSTAAISPAAVRPAIDFPPTIDSPNLPAKWPVQFQDVLAETGINFQHTDGSSGQRYVIESMTGGVALLDYDGDGYLDIYFLNGAPLQGTHVEQAPTNALYRNNGNWQFTDVTAEAGVGDTGYGLGVCVGDYNNDGYPDLYVNNFGRNVLYENKGDGTFIDSTAAAGVANGDRVGAGASFFDMNGDGSLDLYVANYIQFSYDEHRPHSRRGLPAYPSPMSYLPDPDTLLRNNGDGTFSDVSAESGIAAHAGTGMGVICLDYDDDGDLDVFVANDQRANFLFQNDGRGNFKEVALLVGAGLDFGGHPQATMGVDAGDFDNDGRLDLHTTSFSGELATLYRSGPDGFFEDATRASGAGAGTFPHVTWGNAFADFDNDGNRDLFIACGHLDDNLDQRGGNDTTAYMVPNVVLRNTGSGTFVDVSRDSGDAMQSALSSRGMAVGDLNDDGTEDVVVLNSRREPTVLRNNCLAPHHWIRVRLCGVASNRSGIGARVTVVAGDSIQVSEMHSGRGYQSHFGDPLPFGLGARERIDRIEVRWLGGRRDIVENPAVDQVLTIIEATTGF